MFEVWLDFSELCETADGVAAHLSANGRKHI